MESSNHPLPTDPQLPPVPAGVEYSREHAEAIEKGRVSLAKIGKVCILGAAAGFNLWDMAGGSMMTLTGHTEAVPVADESSVSQAVDSSYAQGDIIEAATHGPVSVSELSASGHQTDHKDDKHDRSAGLSKDFFEQDPGRFSDLEQDMSSDPPTPQLPDDFPAKKLPIKITVNTPADALKDKKLANV